MRGCYPVGRSASRARVVGRQRIGLASSRRNPRPPHGMGEVMRRPVLALVAVLAVIALVPAAADARTNIRLGVGDQHVSMFDQPAFKSTKLKKVRYFVPWNAMDHPSELSKAEAFVERANEDGISVLLHISSDDLRLKKAKLPTVRQYRSKVGN